MPNRKGDVTITVAQAIAGAESAAELKRQLDERAAAAAAEAAKPLPLGLHFDLPMDRYLADKGLGSGDIKECAKDAFEFWWNSWMNPVRPEEDEDTPSQKYGKALHKCVLEGREWFDAHYVRGPDQTGLSQGKKSASTRAANEAAAAMGKESVKFNDYARIIVAAAMIAKNTDLTFAFSNGCPEVSFIWMRDDVRCKMRIDYLKPISRGGKIILGIGDLKSIGRDWRTDDFVQSCYNAVDDWDYHVQASDYLDGARHIKKAITDGLVHYHNDRRFDQILERLTQAEAMAWQWVFHKTTGAPKTHSMVLSPGSQFLSEGRDIVDRGIANYREWMERKGPNEMWVEPTPVHEAEFERMPKRQHYGR
jgi:hypothetical protein